jgi:hypothetical protein
MSGRGGGGIGPAKIAILTVEGHAHLVHQAALEVVEAFTGVVRLCLPCGTGCTLTLALHRRVVPEHADALRVVDSPCLAAHESVAKHAARVAVINLGKFRETRRVCWQTSGLLHGARRWCEARIRRRRGYCVSSVGGTNTNQRKKKSNHWVNCLPVYRVRSTRKLENEREMRLKMTSVLVQAPSIPPSRSPDVLRPPTRP